GSGSRSATACANARGRRSRSRISTSARSTSAVSVSTRCAPSCWAESRGPGAVTHRPASEVRLYDETMSGPSLSSRSSLAARLDALPFTRSHLRVLTGSGVGWALDAMDVGLISFIIAVLAQQWSLTPTETGWIASVGFIGMAVGASLGGLLADRLGRRQVFAITLLVYGIATGASALVGGVAMLLVLRFFVGLGLGAELPVASTYVSEFAPAAIRGRLIVILEAFWAVGWTASALIGYFVIPASGDGWRWAFALGAIPAAYALFV